MVTSALSVTHHKNVAIVQEQHETKHCKKKGVEGLPLVVQFVRRPHSMEQCLPRKKEGNEKSGTSQANPEHLLARPFL